MRGSGQAKKHPDIRFRKRKNDQDLGGCEGGGAFAEFLCVRSNPGDGLFFFFFFFFFFFYSST